MLKNKLSKSIIVGAMGLTGLVVGIATMAGAQSVATSAPATSATVTNQTVDTPEPGDLPDAPGATESKTHGHAPLGGDGVVSSINGTTIILGEESNEGGASYTVDASKATVTNNGVAGTISDIKVGEKIFVQGVTTGTNVAAISISVGHRGEKVGEANDTDGSAASEASEPAGSSDGSDK